MIATICGDPGGAKVIVPIVELLKKKKIKHINYTYHQAIQIFQNHQLEPISLKNGSIEIFKSKLIQNDVNFLITATSHNHLNFEKLFIAAANELKIDSLTVLDFWSNYAKRFSDINGQLIYLPSTIALMDDEAKRQAINEGIPKDKIIITGQPAFDSLFTYHRNFKLEMKKEIRRKLKVKDNDWLVTFCSQPLKKVFGVQNNSAYMGFDEEFVLHRVLQALEKISINQKKSITLLIRPHPREKESDYAHYNSSIINVIISIDGNSHDYIKSSELVIGMNSILLLEACYLNAIVLSLQPNLTKKDPLPCNEWGTSLAIYNEADIENAIQSCLCDEITRNELFHKTKKLRLSNKASIRIVDFIFNRLK